MPIDFQFERKIQKQNGYKLIVGLDEVGRGPLAGPVTVAAFVFFELPNLLGSDLGGKRSGPLRFLRDSKLLSAKQREELYQYFCELKKEGRVDFACASVFPATIDKKNINKAEVLAMRRAVKKLSHVPDHAVIDKFLYAGVVLSNVSYSMVKKADNLVPSCAAASIVGKVHRDATMVRYHKKFPQYGFNTHKGYGTVLHYEMLKKHGPSPIHRKSFRLS